MITLNFVFNSLFYLHFQVIVSIPCLINIIFIKYWFLSWLIKLPCDIFQVNYCANFNSLIIMFLSMFIDGGINAGWTSHAPSPIINYSSIDLMFFSLHIVGLSSLLGIQYYVNFNRAIDRVMDWNHFYWYFTSYYHYL